MCSSFRWIMHVLCVEGSRPACRVDGTSCATTENALPKQSNYTKKKVYNIYAHASWVQCCKPHTWVKGQASNSGHGLCHRTSWGRKHKPSNSGWSLFMQSVLRIYLELRRQLINMVISGELTKEKSWLENICCGWWLKGHASDKGSGTKNCAKVHWLEKGGAVGTVGTGAHSPRNTWW